MYNRLLQLYYKGKINENNLSYAVYKKFITEKEYTAITNKQYIPYIPASKYTLDEAVNLLITEVNK